ncbi:MAG: DUF5615 family PIN-like protein [Anaerolineales bacterium]|nr:MAG: DUF5615 family PIN-like protein [Anaerolineales bacterium]
MNILANENVPQDTVVALQERGHDVRWVRTDAPGSSDEQVLARAQVEDRILVTFDKDFGELAFRVRLPASTGIVLLRISSPSSAHVSKIAVAVLESRTDWAGHFSVIEDNRIRMTPLPQQG